MTSAVQRRIQRLIGLGVRSRGAVIGVEQVRDAAKRDQLMLAVVATDASPHSREKLLPLLRARRISFIELPSAAELGAAVGREQVAAVGIVDRQLAKGIREVARSGSSMVESSQEGL